MSYETMPEGVEVGTPVEVPMGEEAAPMDAPEETTEEKE